MITQTINITTHGSFTIRAATTAIQSEVATRLEKKGERLIAGQMTLKQVLLFQREMAKATLMSWTDANGVEQNRPSMNALLDGEDADNLVAYIADTAAKMAADAKKAFDESVGN